MNEQRVFVVLYTYTVLWIAFLFQATYGACSAMTPDE